MAAAGAFPVAAAAAGGSFAVAKPRGWITSTRPRSSLSPFESASSSGAVAMPSPAASGSVNGSLRSYVGLDVPAVPQVQKRAGWDGEEDEVKGSAVDYFEQAKDLIRPDGGPPRWFSPLESSGGGKRLKNAPLLLYLPGIDGVGLGLTRHHRRLDRMFDVWCLHIPVMDRTSFTDIVKLVENTVKVEHDRSPSRPIYLVGESLGACLAMVAAARNPGIDLVLILANPATSVNHLQLQALTTLLEFIPSQPFASIPYLLSLLRGYPGEELFGPQAAEDLSRSLLALSSSFSVIAEILPRETLLWKLELLKLASFHANARLHAIISETLILSSGIDALLPNQEESERLRHLLPQCEIRKFNDNGHFLFLEDGVDLVDTIKRAGFYRRGRKRDYVTDFVPPNSTEYGRACREFWLFDAVASPVLFSTLENGQIVKGLSGYPSEGPVLLVGYHMLMGFELYPLISGIYNEKKIIVRGIAHPMLFTKPGESKDLDQSMFDAIRLMGAVPVSGTNMFKLLSSKSHVLLYPGGVREALHRKGEAYQLFWPEESEFVRMAARFGAKIVPFGAVGEDDIAELILDYDDLMRIPFFKEQIEDLSSKSIKLRTDTTGEVANQDLFIPGVLPKPPGRLYYLFGKPIETEGLIGNILSPFMARVWFVAIEPSPNIAAIRHKWDLLGLKEELNDREKAHEVYLRVKSEVERCLEYLKEKREHDPYRSILSRTLYQAANGRTADVPAFEP